eukprot:jgi/Psemu1/29405/gm1.29405_g
MKTREDSARYIHSELNAGVSIQAAYSSGGRQSDNGTDDSDKDSSSSSSSSESSWSDDDSSDGDDGNRCFNRRFKHNLIVFLTNSLIWQQQQYDNGTTGRRDDGTGQQWDDGMTMARNLYQSSQLTVKNPKEPWKRNYKKFGWKTSTTPTRTQ